ncbi:hypothetical protein CBP52_02450 [Cellulomonas sp. PSBB021]|nr:hypothetical protein CBP52_02450 [Cellulomonas sp. PSBB021]
MQGLHAKLILSGGDSPSVVVGSANISARSRDYLGEAAIRTQDPEIVSAVAVQLDQWIGEAVRIDAAWLKRATRLYRQSGIVLRGRASVDLPREARIWLISTIERTRPVPAFVEQAAEVAMRSLQFGHDLVTPFELIDEEGEPVREGDVLIRANATPDERRTRAQPSTRGRVWCDSSPPPKASRRTSSSPRTRVPHRAARSRSSAERSRTQEGTSTGSRGAQSRRARYETRFGNSGIEPSEAVRLRR